jgi:hypothetical protein
VAAIIEGEICFAASRKMARSLGHARGVNQVFIPPAFETLSDSAAVARKRMVDSFESVEGKQLWFPYLDIWPVYATYSTSDRGSDNRSNTGSQGHCQSTPKSHSSRGS